MNAGDVNDLRIGENKAMSFVAGSFVVNRRKLLRSSVALAASGLAAPALIGRAQAAVLKLKLSSSLANDPKFANGRVYYDNLVNKLAGSSLAGQIEVAFFPDNQLGQ